MALPACPPSPVALRPAEHCGGLGLRLAVARRCDSCPGSRECSRASGAQHRSAVPRTAAVCRKAPLVKRVTAFEPESRSEMAVIRAYPLHSAGGTPLPTHGMRLWGDFQLPAPKLLLRFGSACASVVCQGLSPSSRSELPTWRC